MAYQLNIRWNVIIFRCYVKDHWELCTHPDSYQILHSFEITLVTFASCARAYFARTAKWCLDLYEWNLWPTIVLSLQKSFHSWNTPTHLKHMKCNISISENLHMCRKGYAHWGRNLSAKLGTCVLGTAELSRSVCFWPGMEEAINWYSPVTLQ